MNEQIMKPMSVERMEFMRSLTDLINNSKLPPFVIEPILKDFHQEVRNLAGQQYEVDVKRYQEQIRIAQEEES